MHPGESELEARIASYELAPVCKQKPQKRSTSKRKPLQTHQMYGLDNPETREYGTRCLIARRLVERGVRSFSCFTVGNHGTITAKLRTGSGRYARKRTNLRRLWLRISSNAACSIQPSCIGVARLDDCLSHKNMAPPRKRAVITTARL